MLAVDAPSREDAEELKGKVVKKFEKIAPEFVSWLEDNVDEGLTVFDFPRSWWRRIRTINGLERLHREIRRRTRVVGIFPHEASALRLISAVLAEIHEEWLTGRQYLNLAGWKKQVEQSFPKGPKGNYRKTVAQPWGRPASRPSALARTGSKSTNHDLKSARAIASSVSFVRRFSSIFADR